jgi:hypothetical protein
VGNYLLSHDTLCGSIGKELRDHFWELLRGLHKGVVLKQKIRVVHH